MGPALCSTGLGLGPPWSALDLMLALNSPGRLAAGSALMVGAMMTPLLLGPLRHLRERSFADRRPRATLLFVAGYAGMWALGAAGLEIAALAARAASSLPLGLAALAALLWQLSPAKQLCLNACHRRPALAAFGASADRDAFLFGLFHSVACFGACWALMLLAFSIRYGHLAAMIAIALFVAAERLERPGPLDWRLRWPAKAMRILLAYAREATQAAGLTAISVARSARELLGSGRLFGRAA